MEQNNAVETEKIRSAVHMGLPLSITTYTFPRQVELYVDQVLSVFLNELHHPEMKDFLAYMISELATNAKKANTKRVYFEEKKLNIHDEKDYEIGMRFFKADTLVNIQHYLQLQKEKGLYVRIVLQHSEDSILLEVRNNSELTRTEFKRIFDKIARSRQYTALEEVLPKVFDDNEGAGLGLIISILMMRKIGVPGENFFVLVENGETIMRVIVPLQNVREEKANLYELSKQIVAYIDTIPKFPDNIMRIERLLDDPTSDIVDIALNLGNDVALTADLLKLVNSASFGLQQKITGILDAVKLVGTRGIRNLLYSIGVMNLLGDQSSEVQGVLWDHSYRTAFCACWLARHKTRKAGLVDVSYVCGLLHDLGKIVISLMYPDPALKEKILRVKDLRHIPDEVFSVLLSDASHPEIGAALAEKWNFPQMIVASIRWHHEPAHAPEAFQEIVTLVSFADMMVHFQRQDIAFYQIPADFLQKFAIPSEDAFQSLCAALDAEFAADSGAS